MVGNSEQNGNEMQTHPHALPPGNGSKRS